MRGAAPALVALLATAAGAHDLTIPDGLPPGAQAAYRAFPGKTGHRAFAWNGEKAYGYSWDAISEEGALEGAVSACDRRRGWLAELLGGGPPTCRPIAFSGRGNRLRKALDLKSA